LQLVSKLFSSCFKYSGTNLKALFDPTPCPPDFFENASFDTLYSH
jgi:hypothetical protein